jgi:NADPH:quinone reductase-like Zn-dependent oxidoreductase
LKAQFANGSIDVVLDYLWGESARRILFAAAKAGKEAVPVRFVQIGSVSNAEISLPSAVLRSSALELMGSGIGSIPMERLKNAIAKLFEATVPGGFEIATQTVPLAEVEKVWATDTGSPRTVFTIGPDKS